MRVVCLFVCYLDKQELVREHVVIFIIVEQRVPSQIIIGEVE